mmetsp:Transcript_49313/g.138678  ORF Transcript_49313/g.138678 Transcript_49313/m.138678 type:complete len:271 (-) Transcript_49313:204-1016(-)
MRFAQRASAAKAAAPAAPTSIWPDATFSTNGACPLNIADMPIEVPSQTMGCARKPRACRVNCSVRPAPICTRRPLEVRHSSYVWTSFATTGDPCARDSRYASAAATVSIRRCPHHHPSMGVMKKSSKIKSRTGLFVHWPFGPQFASTKSPMHFSLSAAQRSSAGRVREENSNTSPKCLVTKASSLRTRPACEGLRQFDDSTTEVLGPAVRTISARRAASASEMCEPCAQTRSEYVPSPSVGSGRGRSDTESNFCTHSSSERLCILAPLFD